MPTRKEPESDRVPKQTMSKYIGCLKCPKLISYLMTVQTKRRSFSGNLLM
jgi:hypothetical protein